jgi:hypothetical protein
MCDKCDELQRKIVQHGRFLAEPFDPLTKERIKAGLEDLKKQKAAMHEYGRLSWRPLSFSLNPFLGRRAYTINRRVGDQLPACQMVLDVIGDLPADRRQLKRVFFRTGSSVCSASF